MQYYDVSKLKSVKKENLFCLLKFVKIHDFFFQIVNIQCEFSNYDAVWQSVV